MLPNVQLDGLPLVGKPSSGLVLKVYAMKSPEPKTLIEFLKALPGASNIKVISANQNVGDPSLSPSVKRALIRANNTAKQ
jgi:hypothetical protein